MTETMADNSDMELTIADQYSNGENFSSLVSSQKDAEVNVNGALLTSETQTTSSDPDKYTVQVVTKYMCRYCARQFESPDEMQEHIASHAKGKATSHSCYVCGRTYSTPSKLQRHVRVHSGERPYACQICGRRFTRSDHVKQHLKVHMPQKERNTCRICGMKFLRRQTLHSHLQQSHGVTHVFTCHRCGEAFDGIEKLHSHKNSHLSIYAGNKDGPEVEGGMVIKHERGPNSNASDEQEKTMVIGLAKFSLGPQPQVEEGDSTEHLDLSSVALGNSITGPGWSKIPMEEDWVSKSNGAESMEDKNDASNHDASDQLDSSHNESYTDFPSSTITNGNEMFILPDLKKVKDEPVDDSYEQANNDYQIEENLPEVKIETDIDMDAVNPLENYKSDTESTGKQTATSSSIHKEYKTSLQKDGRKVTEIVVFPKPGVKVTSYTQPVTSMTAYLGKKKLLGPASYKAAMRKKIEMNYPYPRNKTLRQLVHNLGMDNSAVGVDNSSPEPVSPPEKKAVTQSTLQEMKLPSCEHCGIWFEDYSMSLLHNSLHLADEGDPFTCRKCLKKLGNRLEFTAHLIWHLEPTLDG